jgi:transcriptional regulator with XRE-family HTH domain
MPINKPANGLRRLRERLFMTQSDLARSMGMQRQATISAWELGEDVPSLRHRRRLCEVLGVKPDELMAALAEKEAKGSDMNQEASGGGLRLRRDGMICREDGTPIGRKLNQEDTTHVFREFERGERSVTVNGFTLTLHNEDQGR